MAKSAEAIEMLVKALSDERILTRGLNLELQQARREFDAAVSDMSKAIRGRESCMYCKNFDTDKYNCKWKIENNNEFCDRKHWEWRGIQKRTE